MAVLVESRFGRKALLDCMLDMRELLVLYNRVAVDSAGTLALWSPEFLARLKGLPGRESPPRF